MLPSYQTEKQKSIRRCRTTERIRLQNLRGPAVVLERGNGGKGAGGVSLIRLRADARAGFPGAEDRQQDGGAERTVHLLGEEAYGRSVKYVNSGNYFSLPNEIFLLGLSPGELAVYSFLKRCENRKTHQCWPSYRTIGQAVGMSENTVRKYTLCLEERGLISTEPTEITTRAGQKRNGNLLYTLRPIQEVIDEHYDRQLEQLEISAARQRTTTAQASM